MAGVITGSGTWTVPDVKGKDVGGSGVAFTKTGDDDFDARASIRTGKNLYDEAQQVVALFAEKIGGVSANVAVDTLLKILVSIRSAPQMGERVYQQ